MKANDRQEGGSHYKSETIQHWDLVAKNRVGYLEGNATKYLTRWRKKNGKEDLKKALHYVDKAIELAESNELANSSEFAVESNAAEAMVQGFIQGNDLGARGEFAFRQILYWVTSEQLRNAAAAIHDMIGDLDAATS